MDKFYSKEGKIMIELYADISEEFREYVNFIFDMSLRQKNPMAGAQTLMNFLNSCTTDEQREYATLVFYTKLTERLES